MLKTFILDHTFVIKKLDSWRGVLIETTHSNLLCELHFCVQSFHTFFNCSISRFPPRAAATESSCCNCKLSGASQHSKVSASTPKPTRNMITNLNILSLQPRFLFFFVCFCTLLSCILFYWLKSMEQYSSNCKILHCKSRIGTNKYLITDITGILC